MKELRRRPFLGKGNPNYKEIDPEEIYNMVRNGCSNKEIIEELKISESTMIKYLRKHYNTTATQIRKELGFLNKNWIFENYRSAYN